MPSNFHIDQLDKKILGMLIRNARVPFMEIARKCKVSGAAIHQRVKALSDAGIISGSHYLLDPKANGYLTCAFIGIQVHLRTTKSHLEVYDKIQQIPEIVECHHISGKYSLLVKLYARNNEHLKSIIIERIQTIPEVTFTETFISLEEGFIRQIQVE